MEAPRPPAYRVRGIGARCAVIAATLLSHRGRTLSVRQRRESSREERRTMKTLWMLAVAATTLAVATPAFADTTPRTEGRCTAFWRTLAREGAPRPGACEHRAAFCWSARPVWTERVSVRQPVTPKRLFTKRV